MNEKSCRVLFFGPAREAAGREVMDVPVRPGLTISDLWKTLQADHSDLQSLRGVRLAKNHVYAADHDPVVASDEIAVIPPVSGG
ncbi:MAG: MoaD/ThiS family protein [Terrimicrobiaceae bacterium]|nr:MoaD/ThiS family protein [Terrimicrobiaceae bacterium]